MKLRYFIPLFIAAVAMFTGCSDDDDAIYLDNISVSTSFVSLSTDGAPTEVRLKAADSWNFDEKTVPNWLTITPMSGGAGETKLTFSASAAEGRTAVLKLNCGGQTQEINIIQGIAKVESATCAQVIAGADAKTYMVTGVCTGIANTSYGNWYLNDGTGEVYIYGTVDASGKYNWASFGIEVGDEVTVQGPKTTYNGTVELVDVTVVKVNKSLIKVDSLTIGGVKTTDALPIEGGDIVAAVTCKGNGINVEIPADAKDWLFISAITSKGVTFHALPNNGGDRSTTVTFKTYNGKKEYTSQVSIAQKGAILEVPIADFLAAEVGDTQYRLTGVITELYASDKQGKSFYIQDYSGKTLVYRAEGFIEAGAKVGDVVTVVGKRSAYKDSPQMGSVTFEELKYAVTEVSLTEFLAKEPAANVYYRISGTIDEIANDQYGNLYLTDGTERVYVYGCYPGWGATGDARKGLIGALGIKVGDKLSVIGVRADYKGTPQLSNGIYFSHESAE